MLMRRADFIHSSVAIQPIVSSWPVVSFVILYTVRSTNWTRDQSVAKPVPTQGTTQTLNRRTQILMLEWDSNTQAQNLSGRGLHASDRLDIVISTYV
jgi:hypothetical protein